MKNEINLEFMKCGPTNPCVCVCVFDDIHRQDKIS